MPRQSYKRSYERSAIVALFGVGFDELDDRVFDGCEVDVPRGCVVGGLSLCEGRSECEGGCGGEVGVACEGVWYAAGHGVACEVWKCVRFWIFCL